MDRYQIDVIYLENKRSVKVSTLTDLVPSLSLLDVLEGLLCLEV